MEDYLQAPGTDGGDEKQAVYFAIKIDVLTMTVRQGMVGIMRKK